MTNGNCPDGTYEAVATITNTEDGPTIAQFGESSGEAKTKQIVVHMQIISGPEKGRVLPWIGYFTQKTVNRTLESLRLMGMKGEDLYALWGVNAQKLDQVVNIVVQNEEYNGKTRAKIQWVNAPGGGGLQMKNRYDEKTIRLFAAKMKKTMKGVPEVDGQKSSDTAQDAHGNSDTGSSSQDNGDDDIPF